jgi:hypothetical protein
MIYEAFEEAFQQRVHVHINAVSDYHPFASEMNGWSGPYASINVNAGTQVDLRFSLWTAAEHPEPLTFSELAVTFVDLDEYVGGACQEFVTAEGYNVVIREPTTELVEEAESSTKKRFHASTRGDGTDNPTITESLTQQQKDRSIMFFYRNVHDFNITIGAGDGRVPRFFMLVGRPLLVCARTLDLIAEPAPTPAPGHDNLARLPPLPECDRCWAVEDVGSHSSFLQWFVEQGDTVRTGDPVALIRHRHDGTLDILTASMTGEVVHRQLLQEGDNLDTRMTDKVLAVIRHAPVLPPVDTEGSTVVRAEPGSIFIEWKVREGDNVTSGQTLAHVYLSNRIRGPLLAPVPGLVTHLQDLHNNDVIGELCEDRIVATITEYEEVSTTEAPIASFPSQASYPQIDITVSVRGVSLDALDQDPELRDAFTSSLKACVADASGGLNVGGNGGVFSNDVIAGPLRAGSVVCDLATVPPPGISPEQVRTNLASETSDGTLADSICEHIQLLPRIEAALTSSLECSVRSAPLIVRESPSNGWGAIHPTLWVILGICLCASCWFCARFMLLRKEDEGKQEYAPLVRPTVPPEPQGLKPMQGPPWQQQKQRMPPAYHSQTPPQSLTPGRDPPKALMNQWMPPGPAPLPTMTQIAPRPKPQARANQPPTPQGVRFDFRDRSGAIQTRYFLYRPMGVEFEAEAPARVKSFTFNSYAKANTVEVGWSIVRVGTQEVEKEPKLDKVKQLIGDALRSNNVWPLKLEFQVPLGSVSTPRARTMKEWSSEHEIFHVKRQPLGIEIPKDKVPLLVEKVYPGSYAAEAGIKENWRIVRIADENVEDCDYKQAKARLDQGVANLDSRPIANPSEK